MNYAEAEQLIFNQLPFFKKDGPKAIKYQLKNIESLCAFLGNPQQQFKSVHIAGTNGKGSTSHFLASVFQEAKYKTGLYTSPHLKDYRERFKINGQEIPESVVAEFISLVKDEIAAINPTFFEVSVAMAFYWFAREKVDVAIIEVGLGGRLDSTNIITPLLSVITSIGLDHQDVLGDTIEKISLEKAGIIKPGIPVVLGDTNPEVVRVVTEVAQEKNAPLSTTEGLTVVQHEIKNGYLNVTYQTASGELLKLSSGLMGDYQLFNLKTVIVAFQILRQFYDMPLSALMSGVEKVIPNTGLKGRWQILSEFPLTICDTGHNEAAWSYINPQLKSIPAGHYHLVLGFSKDKKIDEIMANLPQPHTIYFSEFDSTRSLTPEGFLRKGYTFAASFTNVNAAITHVKQRIKSGEMIFVGGSTFLVAEIDDL